MIAAIYARKSTEQAVADESKSVARQVAHAREHAEHLGRTFDDAWILAETDRREH